MIKTADRAALLVAGAVATMGTVAATVGFAPAAHASPPPGTYAFASYDAVDADGGVYWRSAPDWNTPIQQPGYGFYTNDEIALYCYEWGGPAGPYTNTLWYYGEIYGGLGTGEGWINDHYLDTPGTASAPQPQGPPCPTS